MRASTPCCSTRPGTLSEGRLAVARIVAAPGIAEQTVLLQAVAIEGASTHPVAEALRRELERRGLAPGSSRDARRAIAGRGVVAEDGDRVDIVGTRALLRENAVRVDDALERAERGLAERGASLAWVASGGHALGLVALVDPLRPDARTAADRLRALGVDVALISGDHADAVALAAAGAGIESYAAGVLPAEKVDHVRRRRAAGARVLMAGDGINDAAALAAADVGLAMGRGAEVAVHAADVVVRAPRVGAIADAIGLSRATMRRVRENLALAVLYNAVAIPLAALGWLDPLTAAIAMSLSSVAVTSNAVRLLTWRARR